jgi:cytochrome P450
MWIAVVCVCLCVAVWLYSIRARTISGVPVAPNALPFFGHLFVLRHLGTKKFLDEAVTAALTYPERHHTFSFPDKPIVLRLCTPAAVQYILKDEFDKYVKIDSENTRMLGDELFGDGIFAVDGDKWKFERKVASHMFATKVLKEKMEQTFLEHGDIVLEYDPHSTESIFFLFSFFAHKAQLTFCCWIEFSKDTGSLASRWMSKIC